MKPEVVLNSVKTGVPVEEENDSVIMYREFASVNSFPQDKTSFDVCPYGLV